MRGLRFDAPERDQALGLINETLSVLNSGGIDPDEADRIARQVVFRLIDVMNVYLKAIRIQESRRAPVLA